LRQRADDGFDLLTGLLRRPDLEHGNLKNIKCIESKPACRHLPSRQDCVDALGISQRYAAHATISDFEVLKAYRLSPSSRRGQEMLQEMLRRHCNLLRKLAWKMANKYSRLHTFDDLMQHAYVGAIIAYNRFDFSKIDEGVNRLSSFVQLTVEKYLLDAMNRDALIQCPSHKRAMRSYLSGRYDQHPEKKAAFEAKHGLTTEAARSEAREKYRGLMPELVSFEMEMCSHKHRSREDGFSYADLVQHRSADIEEDLVEKIDIERAIRQLTPRQQMVCELAMQHEYTNEETADILSKLLRKPITKGMVRSDIRAIRQKLRAAI
jgi:RNA polymerase sigma factor (sigma-70 family)